MRGKVRSAGYSHLCCSIEHPFTLEFRGVEAAMLSEWSAPRQHPGSAAFSQSPRVGVIAWGNKPLHLTLSAVGSVAGATAAGSGGELIDAVRRCSLLERGGCGATDWRGRPPYRRI